VSFSDRPQREVRRLATADLVAGGTDPRRSARPRCSSTHRARPAQTGTMTMAAITQAH